MLRNFDPGGGVDVDRPSPAARGRISSSAFDWSAVELSPKLLPAAPTLTAHGSTLPHRKIAMILTMNRCIRTRNNRDSPSADSSCAPKHTASAPRCVYLKWGGGSTLLRCDPQQIPEQMYSDSVTAQRHKSASRALVCSLTYVGFITAAVPEEPLAL